MKLGLILIVLFSFLAAVGVHSHDSARTRVPIDHILSVYSENNGVDFVVDARVRGFVDVIGLNLNQITTPQLLDILLHSNIIALSKNGVVYIVPKKEYDVRGGEMGELWIGE